MGTPLSQPPRNAPHLGSAAQTPTNFNRLPSAAETQFMRAMLAAAEARDRQDRDWSIRLARIDLVIAAVAGWGVVALAAWFWVAA